MNAHFRAGPVPGPRFDPGTAPSGYRGRVSTRSKPPARFDYSELTVGMTAPTQTKTGGD